jgi:hypothetical protein
MKKVITRSAYKSEFLVKSLAISFSVINDIKVTTNKKESHSFGKRVSRFRLTAKDKPIEIKKFKNTVKLKDDCFKSKLKEYKEGLPLDSKLRSMMVRTSYSQDRNFSSQKQKICQLKVLNIKLVP